MRIVDAAKERARFALSSAEAARLPAPRVPLSYALEFLRDGETPGRVLNDVCMHALMPALCGPGTIVELGGAGDYYRNFAPREQPYEVTNVCEPCDRIVDMTSMPYAGDSVDAFMSMFALEHIYDFQAVLDECYRCLKPAGRMLLAVPFMYYYHGAPDDFFRFTASALDRMLARFSVLQRLSFGNRGLIVCQLFHEKRVLGSTRGPLARFALRVMYLPVLLAGLLGDQRQATYAVTHLYLCEKPSSAAFTDR